MQARSLKSRPRTTDAATGHTSLAVAAALPLALALVIGTPATAQPNDTNEDAGNGDDDQGADTVEENPPDLVACVPNSPWCKTFYFGVQFLPDYDDEDDTFDGLGESGLLRALQLRFPAHQRVRRSRRVRHPLPP